MRTLSDYALATLWKDGELVLSRGRGGDGLSPILAMTAASTPPAPMSLARLEHAFALRDELDPAWAARPRALERHPGHCTLVLDDPGGEVLARLVGHPWDLGSFLRVATGLAVALGRLHERGLVHKDIKPANLLVDVATGEAWLTGFGIASRLPRERQAAEPPEVIAGTLAYMAPEQTGRMNRSIDSRSDLYSLGVTLYEVLTGALPFSAADPMEWIHCHVARPPPPLRKAPGGQPIPDPIAAILLKLLAKTAEDRYQTASGLAADLRRCLKEWTSLARVDWFPLGANDALDRLILPEKLYGREREIEALLAAFDRVVTHGTPQLVLVSGYSGIGKSSVVNELHKALVPPRGLFASGKFDQYKRDIPYATLTQAFRTLVRQILGKSDAEVGVWRGALREALGINGQLIVKLIPELEVIVGEQPPVPDLPPREARSRFQTVFRRFLGVFARAAHPLALFVDDLQWIDAATLDLFEYLLGEPEVRHLLVVGAYRDNEVDAAHPLVRTIGAIRDAGVHVREVVLAPLGLDDVGRLIADSLKCDRDRALPLAELVHERAGGNPFFSIQFLTVLAEEGLLAFDPTARSWAWDLPRIHAKGFTDNVVELIAGKLTRLPDVTQEALRHLAYLGNHGAIERLVLLRGDSEERLHAALWEAIRAGLVLRREGAYAFLHDRIQEAAYALLPEAERAAEHLRIGRLLVARTAGSELENDIFDVVNHLNRGAELIDERGERERIARLNLVAGEQARVATAHASALRYFGAGEALLGEDRWERSFDLAFSLACHRCQCELLTGKLTAAEQGLAELSTRAGSLTDLAAVTSSQIDLFTLLGRSDRSVLVGLEFLRHVGVEWSPHPSRDEVQREYDRMWQQIGSRSIEELVDLPLLRDPLGRATIDVLAKLQVPAFFSDENLHGLVIGRMANLSLEHGNSDGSCFAYCELGGFLGAHFGDYARAARFSKLSVELVERPGLGRFKARVYCAFGYVVTPWTAHVRAGIAPLRRSNEVASSVGDLLFVVYTLNHFTTFALAMGDPLSEALRDAERWREITRKARFGLVVDCFTAQMGLVRSLQGSLSDFASFVDIGGEAGGFEQRLEADPRLALATCWYWIRKLQALWFGGDPEGAVEAASKAERLLWTSRAFFEVTEYHLYAALARAACHDTAPADARRRHKDALAAHSAQLAVWASNCPENFASPAALVAAEIARIEQRELAAEHLYEDAIRAARQHGFITQEAIANELAGRFYLARGFETIARAYQQNARYAYQRWGALAKVSQLERQYPYLRSEPAVASPTATMGTPVGQIDFASVVKISQAVSSEIVLGKLIERLMVIAVEHAGASRCLLIIPGGDVQRIEAEATTGHDTVTVHFLQAPVTPAELPESVLRYVLRSQESVMLDDASAPNQFSADDYLRRTRARSVLCLPLVKLGTLIGVLYLENNLAPYVFTPGRTALLELLAAQAAISLENARVYAGMQRSLEERESLLKEVHHRVKNNLQLISSLLNLQRSRTTDSAVAELFGDSRNRVRAMALVHENLYRAGNFARIPMADHIQQLCAYLRRVYGMQSTHVELVVQVSDVHLDMDRAVSCGLIINELVSNALKHAFPDDRAGRVSVELQPCGDRRYALVVADDGAGLPSDLDFAHAESMGLQLVHDLTSQLHGSVALRRDGGTTFLIHFDESTAVSR